jgi:adenylate cyclase
MDDPAGGHWPSVQMWAVAAAQPDSVECGMNGIRRTGRAALTELWRPGEGDMPGSAMWRIGSVALAIMIVLINLAGAGAVVVIAAVVVPEPTSGSQADHIFLVNGVVALIYVAIAVPLGVVIGTRALWRLRDWLVSERDATLKEIRLVLYAPFRLLVVQLSLWWAAAILFGVLDTQYSGQLAVRVGFTVALTGVVTASTAYLMMERLLRSAAARALVRGRERRFFVPGVATRAVLAWAVGTGVLLAGLVSIGVLALVNAPGISVSRLGVAMVALGGTGIVVGLLAVILAARTTADPIGALRRALARVRTGDFDVRVPVYDGSQIGQLQLGFNEMVGGLAERERIREAFGTYVDPQVAEHILEEGTDLAGEQVEVTVMFLDVRNFTGFAERTAAPEVVAAINQLFEQVVPIIHSHEGRVDKFVGDGLLAVFGAPRRLSDHADRGLAAALEIARIVRSGKAGKLEIGIGLNSGTVVAGNIGGDQRYEFSVIGDAVNVAARVEAATRQTGDQVLISDPTAKLLREPPAELVERPGVELKGKRQTVRVFAPDTESSHQQQESGVA